MLLKLIELVNVLLIYYHVDGYNITDVQILKNYLLVDRVYDKTIRPVVNQSHLVEIQITLAVTSIVEFDLVSGRIALSGYLYASWTDEQLQWNPLNFNGIPKVLVDKDLIWTPGLKNGYDLDDTFAVSRVHVYPNGRVTWVPANIFYSICIIDITFYPYDEHLCQFPIFSASDDGSTMQFVPLSHKINLNNFNEHGEWDVSETTSDAFHAVDPQVQTWLSGYLATMKLKRRPGFVVLHTYFPLLLIACVNILAFMVPLGKGERVSFSITLLLALVFFTSSLSDTLPKSSLKTSYFSATMTLAICSSTIGIMLSVILVKIEAETVQPVPRIFYRLRSWYRRRTVICPQKKNTVEDIENDVPANDVKPVLRTEDNRNYVSEQIAIEEEIEYDDPPNVKTSVMTDDTTYNVFEPIATAGDTLTWPRVATALNKILMITYSILLVVSVVVLVVLHHTQ